MATLIAAVGARAACHEFTIVSVRPNPVDEGDVFIVTVERDAAVANSHVRLQTVNETAKAGDDFEAANAVVSFTGLQTSKNVYVQTLDETDVEGAETLKLHLSEPGGCAPNTNYQLGPDKVVTIKASDQKTAPPSAAPKLAPSARPVRTATPRPTAFALTPSPIPPPTLTPSIVITPIPTQEDGVSGLGVTAIVLGVGATGSAGALWYFRRRAGI